MQTIQLDPVDRIVLAAADARGLCRDWKAAVDTLHDLREATGAERVAQAQRSLQSMEHKVTLLQDELAELVEMSFRTFGQHVRTLSSVRRRLRQASEQLAADGTGEDFGRVRTTVSRLTLGLSIDLRAVREQLEEMRDGLESSRVGDVATIVGRLSDDAAALASSLSDVASALGSSLLRKHAQELLVMAGVADGAIAQLDAMCGVKVPKEPPRVDA